MKREILICIDVQKSYAEYYSYAYLKRLLKFLEEKKKEGVEIISLFEPEIDYNMKTVQVAEIPATIMELSDQSGYKLYNHDIIKNTNEEYPLYGIPHEPTFSISLEGVEKVWYNHQSIYYLTPILKHLIEHDKRKVKFILVGGGLSKCVTITYRLLTMYGFDVEVLENQCYEIRIVNSNRKGNAFLKRPSQIPKKHLDEGGNVKLESPKDEAFLGFIQEKLNTVGRRRRHDKRV